MSRVTVVPRIHPSQLRGGLCHLFVLIYLPCAFRAKARLFVLVLGERKGTLQQPRQVIYCQEAAMGTGGWHR